MAGGTRLLLGLVAVAPAVLALTAISMGGQPIAYLLGIVAMLWATILLLCFVALLFRNERLDGVGRKTWMLAFLFAAPIALPMYWKRHVWSAETDRVVHA